MLDAATLALVLMFLLGLFELFLGLFQRYIQGKPQRDWSEIGWLRRIGRILLIAGSLSIFLVPAWLLLAN